MIKYSSVSTDTTNGETHDKIKNYSRKWLTAIKYKVIFALHQYLRVILNPTPWMIHLQNPVDIIFRRNRINARAVNIHINRL